ncbi:MAG: hypothetical protein ABW171_13950 [Steroidobacter sp.]
MQRKSFGIILIVAIGAIETSGASAQTCTPPAGFVDTPHPEIAPIEQLLSHVEEVTIERPLAALLAQGSRARLEQTIDRTSGLPGVVGTQRLTQGPFQAGTRRLVCLTDGSTVVEQVLLIEDRPGRHHFRYVVWKYTSPKFPPIRYAVGEFVRTTVSDMRTHVRWTYSFQPDRQKYPEYLGGYSDARFRESFLEGEFAQWMRNTLASGKKRAEEDIAPAGG